jgi:hypothetical protein
VYALGAIDISREVLADGILNVTVWIEALCFRGGGGNQVDDRVSMGLRHAENPLDFMRQFDC